MDVLEAVGEEIVHLQDIFVWIVPAVKGAMAEHGMADGGQRLSDGR